MTKIQAAVSYKLVSYMRVLTVCELGRTKNHSVAFSNTMSKQLETGK